MAGQLLDVFPDEHPALGSLLLKLLRIPPTVFPALQRISRLLSSGQSAGVVEPTLAPLRDLVIGMAPPPSRAFDLRLDRGEDWMQHPALEAEAKKRGCSVPELALQLSVVMVDQFG